MCSIIAQRKTTLPDTYLELNRTSTMKFFNCFHKKAPSSMFDWVINMPLISISYYSKELHLRCWQCVPDLALLYTYFRGDTHLTSTLRVGWVGGGG